MAKIQLVIEIEERLYKNIIDNDKDDEEFEAMDMAFCNAKPLPKGHGRLIDETDLKTLYGLDDRLWWGNAVKEFTDLPTILEADKGSEDNACLDEGNTR